MREVRKSGISAFNCPNCGAGISHDAVSCRYCGSAIASRICSACYGSVSVGMKHCPHCGKEATEVISETKRDLRCPRCESKLSAQQVGTHLLSSCNSCGGIWVDKASFQDICTRVEEQEAVLGFTSAAKQDIPAPARAGRTYVPCPECGQLMNRKNFSGGSGVVLDWCRDHGSWFDRNELHRTVSFIRQGGLRKSREKEKLRLKEQENQIRMKEFSRSALERRMDSGFVLEPAGRQDPLLRFIFKMFT